MNQSKSPSLSSSRAWRILTSPRLLLVWIILILLFVLTAQLIPQIPKYALSNPVGIENWLSANRSRLGGFGDFLISIGALSIGQSVWLRLILAGTLLSLILVSYETLCGLVGISPSQQTLTVRTVSSPHSPGETLDRFVSHLRPSKTVTSLGDGSKWFGNQLGSILRLVILIVAMLSILAFFWNNIAGWQTEPTVLLPGITVLKLPSGSSAVLDQLNIEWQLNPEETIAQAHLKVSPEYSKDLEGIALESSSYRRGVQYNFLDVGVSLSVRVVDSEKQPVTIQSLSRSQDQDSAEIILVPNEGPQAFSIIDQDIVVLVEVVEAQSGMVQCRIYKGQAGDLFLERTFSSDTVISANGVDIQFESGAYGVVQATYSPGRLMMIAGLALIFMAALITIALRPREVLLQVRELDGGSETRIGTTLPYDRAWIDRTLRSILDKGADK
ncbi:MAG: hypothetical protein ABFQ89_03505 [Chloroflexota bacterium]